MECEHYSANIVMQFFNMTVVSLFSLEVMSWFIKEKKRIETGLCK